MINPTGQNFNPVFGGNGTRNPLNPTPFMPTGGGNYGYGSAGPSPAGSNPMQPKGVPGGGVPSGTSSAGNPWGVLGATMNPATPSGDVTQGPWSPPYGVAQNPTTDATTNEIGKLVGKGIGEVVYPWLQSYAGYNTPLTQQNVNDQIAAMQHNINEGWGNVSTQLGEGGVSPNSSVAALAAGDYFSNASAQENAIVANEYFNMWSQSMSSENNLITNLMSLGGEKQSGKATPLDYISSGLGIGGSIGGAIEGGAGAASGGAGLVGILGGLLAGL